MKFVAQTVYVWRAEIQFFQRFPKLLWATVAVILIPSMYALIYLASVWDPASNTKALSVALVNLDEGVEFREHVFNVGWQVVSKLKSDGQFGYKDYADPVEARQLVRQGKLAFALIIPPDFSSNAIPGAQPGGGKLVVYAAEGNNFEVTALARHFARELGHQVNESLNERRWSLVLSNAAGSQRSVERLHQRVAQIQAGAKELSSGTAQASAGARTLANGADKLHDGVDQLTSGMKQLGAGLRTMDSKRPPNSELNRLKAGADALAAGHVELTQGYESLKTGAAAVDAGMQSFRAEANDSILVSTKIKEGVNQLADGTAQLEAGISTASDAQLKLSDGAG
jgi:putative membrane protein